MDVLRSSNLNRWIAAALILATLGVVGIQLGIFSGQRPDDLGTRDGRIAPCKKSPNCVSSSARIEDAEHFIAPFMFSDSAERAWAILREVLLAQQRSAVERETPVYLHVEFSHQPELTDSHAAVDPADCTHISLVRDLHQHHDSGWHRGGHR